jgi:polyhydroxybutyrate depolymerase
MITALLLALAAHAADFSVDEGRGPIRVQEPAGYDPAVPAPLVMLLHGYGGSGAEQEAYMRFGPWSDSYGFFYLAPDGQEDPFGARFWNASSFCCDFFGDTDDVGYLTRLVESVQAERSIDPKRIYLVGHSNGGFMSHRLACEHAEKFAAIASLAGAIEQEPELCRPSEPVHILQIHGTLDETIAYGGGCGFGSCYPGAVETVRRWAAHNGCTSPPSRTGLLDLDASLDGPDTAMFGSDPCDEGGSVSLWPIRDGTHIPWLRPTFATSVLDHLWAHPKP